MCIKNLILFWQKWDHAMFTVLFTLFFSLMHNYTHTHIIINIYNCCTPMPIDMDHLPLPYFSTTPFPPSFLSFLELFEWNGEPLQNMRQVSPTAFLLFLIFSFWVFNCNIIFTMSRFCNTFIFIPVINRALSCSPLPLISQCIQYILAISLQLAPHHLPALKVEMLDWRALC